MASIIVDFHVHALPDYAESLLPEGPRRVLGQLRRGGRNWLRAISGPAHQAQTLLRHLPDPLRNGLDELGGIGLLPGMLFESTVPDLVEAMENHEVDFAMLIASPPIISNEFVLEAAKEDARLLPAVRIVPGTQRPAETLKSFHTRGARVLKIHPAMDGEGADSKHYKPLLKTAADLGLPVIIHTGCYHASLMFKNTDRSDASHFKPWFEKYPMVPFVLAHMNLHQPQVALDLAQDFGNVYVDTSWQPTEVIGEAVRRIGSERILFGSDWPIVGNNIEVGLRRISEAVETGLITRQDADAILGENARKLMNL